MLKEANFLIFIIIFCFKGGILNLSRRQKLAAQSMIDHSQGSVSDSGRAVTYESSDDETDPLINRNKSAIN